MLHEQAAEKKKNKSRDHSICLTFIMFYTDYTPSLFSRFRTQCLKPHPLYHRGVWWRPGGYRTGRRWWSVSCAGCWEVCVCFVSAGSVHARSMHAADRSASGAPASASAPEVMTPAGTGLSPCSAWRRYIAENNLRARQTDGDVLIRDQCFNQQNRSILDWVLCKLIIVE